jgi:hypothetical protein
MAFSVKPYSFSRVSSYGLSKTHSGATAVLVDELDAGGFRRGCEPLASGCLLLAHFDQRLCGNAQPLMQSPDHFERERAPSV